jgi:ElaB/YqjD/DUF883 family membrane-anchored ribosome-binding protein
MEQGMSSASTASSNMRDAEQNAREDVREGIREIGKAAAAASGDIQKDLQTLRDDIARLAGQVSDILSNRGNAAWQQAKSNLKSGLDDAVSTAQGTGHEAVDALREVSDNFGAAINDSLKERPYTTLAIAAGIGFLFGMTWRR